MSLAADVMAAVLFIFFLVGVGVGVIVVIAISARRADRRIRRTKTPQRNWPGPQPEEPDDDEPDEPPWWQSRDGH